MHQPPKHCCRLAAPNSTSPPQQICSICQTASDPSRVNSNPHHSKWSTASVPPKTWKDTANVPRPCHLFWWGNRGRWLWLTDDKVWRFEVCKLHMCTSFISSVFRFSSGNYLGGLVALVCWSSPTLSSTRWTRATDPITSNALAVHRNKNSKPQRCTLPHLVYNPENIMLTTQAENHPTMAHCFILPQRPLKAWLCTHFNSNIHHTSLTPQVPSNKPAQCEGDWINC